MKGTGALERMMGDVCNVRTKQRKTCLEGEREFLPDTESAGTLLGPGLLCLLPYEK